MNIQRRPPSGRALPTALAAIMISLPLWIANSSSLRADEPKDKPARQPTLGDIIDSSAESVVQIRRQNGAGEATSLGSGFVANAKGLIVTNYHVIRGSSKVIVQFKDGKEYPVKGLRGVDRETDIAVLELEKTPAKIKPLTLGDRKPPRQGESVIAIGHPQGLTFTVTTGIVSAVRKTAELPREMADKVMAPADKLWIQTSAPISPGNSGGPLLDSQGHVIGINTLVAEGQNLGFAIHIGHVLDLLDKPLAQLELLTAARYAKDVENPFAVLEPRVQTMLRDFQSAYNQFRVEVERAESPEAARKILETQNPGPKYARRFYEMAEPDRKTTLAAQCLVLACRLDAQSKDGAYIKKALLRLGEDHVEDRGLVHALVMIWQTQHRAVPDFLRKAISKSPHRNVRGMSSYLLAMSLRMEKETVEAMQQMRAARAGSGDPRTTADPRKPGGKAEGGSGGVGRPTPNEPNARPAPNAVSAGDAASALARKESGQAPRPAESKERAQAAPPPEPDPVLLEQETIRLLESCQKEYKDIRLEGKELAELATPMLYKIRFLSQGKKAPEIASADAEDKQFKLSDYRGKVVLLDFFADWCPHCEAMYPLERRLTKELAGRPFVILGINTDSKDTLRQILGQKKVTWRCWWDGEGQALTKQWQVDGFPRLYLLDEQGVIRKIYEGRPQEKALEKDIKDLVDRVAKAPVAKAKASK
jgi:S1-C subfamily serine protease/peroxiredoxin